MKILQGILITFVFSFAAFGQQVFNWKTLTNMSNIRATAVAGNGIWAATSGGAFFYNSLDTANNKYKVFARADGLEGASLTAVTIDKNDKVWFGSEKGIIDVYNPANNSFKTILDIFDSDKISKTINEITAIGDTAFVSTDYGVSLVNINTLLFVDTYSKFGSLSSNIKINCILKAILPGTQSPLLFVGTDNGLAMQKPGSVNLSAPESWTVYNSFASQQIKKVINYKDNIIAATGKGVYIFDGTLWASYIPDLKDSVIKDISTDGDNLFVLVNKQLYSYNNGSVVRLLDTGGSFAKVTFSSDNGILIGSNAGIIKVNGNDVETIMPNGPYANQFPSLSVDQNGVLWSASGTDVTGVGFYKYEEGTWTNYNAANSPLPANSYFSVYTAPDNTKFFGSWGNGFVRIKNNNIQAFTINNTDLNGTVDDPNYLLISSFATDSKNNTWILNYQSVDKKSLVMLTPDSTWHFFTSPAENGITKAQNYSLVIDQSDTKWYSSNDPDKAGLLYFNENKTYDNAADDKSGYLNTASGLNDNHINCVVVDRRGDIWAGTTFGANVISNTSSILSQKALRVTSVFAVRTQTVNCIAVDPLNQKWVGTNQGLVLINSDGSSLLASFDSKNSPLLNDEIRSIAVDENTGKVYVGTDDGLTSFETMIIKPNESFSELFIYPSPFILKSSDNKLTIDGLIRDCDIKILNTSGKLISQFGSDIISTGSSSSPGGYRAMWDGRDMEGRLVSSGIYFIVAFDKDGNNVSTSKVAVLKE